MASDTPYRCIGRRLAGLRAAYGAGLSKQEWAQRNGFNPTQYHNWESGLRRIPVDQAERLCDTYGLTLDWVYRGRRDGLSENARKVV